MIQVRHVPDGMHRRLTNLARSRECPSRTTCCPSCRSRASGRPRPRFLPGLQSCVPPQRVPQSYAPCGKKEIAPDRPRRIGCGGDLAWRRTRGCPPCETLALGKIVACARARRGRGWQRAATAESVAATERPSRAAGAARSGVPRSTPPRPRSPPAACLELAREPLGIRRNVRRPCRGPARPASYSRRKTGSDLGPSSPDRAPLNLSSPRQVIGVSTFLGGAAGDGVEPLGGTP